MGANSLLLQKFFRTNRRALFSISKPVFLLLKKSTETRGEKKRKVHTWKSWQHVASIFRLLQCLTQWSVLLRFGDGGTYQNQHR